MTIFYVYIYSILLGIYLFFARAISSFVSTRHLCPTLFLGRYCGYPLNRREMLHQMSSDCTKCVVLYFRYRNGCNRIVYTYHDVHTCSGREPDSSVLGARVLFASTRLLVFSNDVLILDVNW